LAVLLAAVAASLFLAACGGESDEEAAPAVVIDGQSVETDAAAAETTDDGAEASDEGNSAAQDDASDSDTSNAEDATGEAATDEELALEFVACMRDNGIDFPDPQINPDGSIVLLPGGPVASGVPVGEPEFQAAAEACGSIVEGASFLPTNQIDVNELEDTLLAFAACVRENGVEINDPDLSQGFPPPGGPASLFGNFDPNDPANADLVATCRQAALDATGFEPPGGA
jgi:hypothetical protein